MSDKKDQRWLKLGVELEGGWKEDYRKVAQLVVGAQGKTDSSVHDLPGYLGEITTAAHSDLEALKADIVKLHPDHSNYTAGFHIHASFSDVDLSMLTSEDFWVYFKKRWEKWGKEWEDKMHKDDKSAFWNRLHCRGDQAKTYCKDEFIPGKQLKEMNRDDRYTQLNFVAYAKFKTVECRVLPMFRTPAITLAAVDELADIYTSFLNTYTFPELALKVALQQDDIYLVDTEEDETPDITFKEDVWDSACPELDDSEGTYYYIEGCAEMMAPLRETINEEVP